MGGPSRGKTCRFLVEVGIIGVSGFASNVFDSAGNAVLKFWADFFAFAALLAMIADHFAEFPRFKKAAWWTYAVTVVLLCCGAAYWSSELKTAQPEYSVRINGVPFKSGGYITIPTTNLVEKLQVTVINEGDIAGEAASLVLRLPKAMEPVPSLGWTRLSALKDDWTETTEALAYLCPAGQPLYAKTSTIFEPIAFDTRSVVGYVNEVVVHIHSKGQPRFEMRVFLHFKSGVGPSYAGF